MILNFQDGSTYEVPFWKKLVGIQKNGHRPISVTFTKKDFEDAWDVPHSFPDSWTHLKQFEKISNALK